MFYTMDFMKVIQGEKPGTGIEVNPGVGRSSCDTGSFPAYGAIYGSPSQCGCNEYLTGYNSFINEPLPAAVDDASACRRGQPTGQPSGSNAE